jgi:hypothetical protein
VTTLAIIATDVGLSGERRLLNGDRAAVVWGVALAGGVCRVACRDHDLEAAEYAQALGATVVPWDELRSASFETAIIGPAAITLVGDERAGRLSESAGAELLFDVLAAERTHGEWKITCDAGRGARDIVTVRGPVVLVVSPDVARPKYVSAYRRSNARHAIDPAGINVGPLTLETSPWQPMTPRTPRPSGAGLADARTRADHAFNMQHGAAAPAQVVITEAPPVAAQLLLRFLVHRGFVTRSLDRLAPVETAATTQSPETDRPKPVEIRTTNEGQLSAAIRRSPRQEVDTEARLWRRPRLRSTPAVQLLPRANTTRLQRGPRRIAPPSQAGLRGPFRIDNGAATN